MAERGLSVDRFTVHRWVVPAMPRTGCAIGRDDC